jgi:hypothetical protein
MTKSISDSPFGTSMASSQVTNLIDTSIISQSGSSSFLKQKPVNASMFGKSMDAPSEFKFSLQSGVQ